MFRGVYVMELSRGGTEPAQESSVMSSLGHRAHCHPFPQLRISQMQKALLGSLSREGREARPVACLACGSDKL